MPRRIVGAAIGSCVHVAGVISFLRLAEELGHHTEFLGPAVSIADLVQVAAERRADMLAVSYRLSPETAGALFAQLQDALVRSPLANVELVFGGTPAVAKVATEAGLFAHIFSGDDGPVEVLAFLRGEGEEASNSGIPPQTLVGRVQALAPYPLLRHHFGLPSLEDTTAGVSAIAQAKVLDVISLGPDQNAQASFFRPHEMDPLQHGAGGVPVRSPEHLRELYAASRTGNYPLMRCYSGTRDLLKWAEMSRDTINNAWAAVPLCWYNVLDGRSNRTPAESIPENLAVMAWHGEHGIPVEVNEAHHWSLREAPDAVAVAAAYLAALNAKQQGVKTYVAQYMFNTPLGTSYINDIAKMLAKRDLIESLHDNNFTSLRQVRTGLMSLSTNMNLAKGQLASSIALALNLQPHIVHVVGYSEAQFAASPQVVIESCQIAHGVIRSRLQLSPDAALDPRVGLRRKELLEQAARLLQAIVALGDGDHALTDPAVIAQAIAVGLLDAPHLKGNRYAKGAVKTKLVNGACVAEEVPV